MRVAYSGRFKRDVRLAQRRGKDMGKLKEIMFLIMEGSLCRDIAVNICSRAHGRALWTPTWNQTGFCSTRAATALCVLSARAAMRICLHCEYAPPTRTRAAVLPMRF